MSARYFAFRRLNPYRGVVQVVEVEDATAHSYDGITWHLRADDGYGWMRPTGIWVVDKGVVAGAGRHPPELLEALENAPPLPFKLTDFLELWLLDKDNGLPLALLDAARPSASLLGSIDPEFHPFLLSYTGFASPSLAAMPHHSGDTTTHRDTLKWQVNYAARPYPAAQWFSRRADGSGEGQGGLRLADAWEGRVLPVEAFPELLVRETWNNRLEQSVINDYHAWVSPFLLQLTRISDATRQRLEVDACARPKWLAKAWPMLPKVIDAPRLHAALVAARLVQANGGPESEAETDLFG